MSKPKQANIYRQWRLEEEFARQLGVPVIDRSSDEKSGLRRDRPGLQSMLERARRREFSHLILYKYDRLSREDVDFLDIVYELFDLGIKVYDTYVGEITPANAVEYAAKSKAEIVACSQRFTAALKDLAGGGMKIGVPPVGYMKGDEPGRYVEDTFALTRMPRPSAWSGRMHWPPSPDKAYVSGTCQLAATRRPHCLSRLCSIVLNRVARIRKA